METEFRQQSRSRLPINIILLFSNLYGSNDKNEKKKHSNTARIINVFFSSLCENRSFTDVTQSTTEKKSNEKYICVHFLTADRVKWTFFKKKKNVLWVYVTAKKKKTTNDEFVENFREFKNEKNRM